MSNTRHINEDQFKFPTRKHIRKQSGFRSSFGPSRSFGGIKGYGTRNFKKKLNEAMQLKDDLVAHDDITTIPKGSDIEVVDKDPSLPDVSYDGTTINVDADKLQKATDKADFKKIFGESNKKFIDRLNKLI